MPVEAIVEEFTVMKALQFEDGQLRLRLIDAIRPGKEDALIRVKKAGICGTDLAIVSGDYKASNSGPVVLGHECFGELCDGVVVGGNIISAGTRVVSEINVSCGACYLCRSGMPTHCLNIRTIGIDRDGAFAESVAVPIRNLHAVPDEVSDSEAVFTEPLAAAIELTKMGSIEEGSSVAIVGCGRLGLLALQVLKKLVRPNKIVAIGRTRGRKLDLAKELGADVVNACNEPGGSSRDTIMEQTPGSAGYDNVVETSGSPTGIDLALDIVKPRGTIHAKSTHGILVPFDLTKTVVKEVRVQGSRCGPFDQAIELLRNHSVQTSQLISKIFSLDDYDKAFDAARDHNTIKVLFSPSE